MVTQQCRAWAAWAKAQLAVEFARRYGRYFWGVHWLNAAQPDLLAAEVALCGAEMGLSPWPEELPTQVRLALGAWQGEESRLVILDSLEDVEVAQGIPAPGKTRSRSFQGFRGKASTR